MDKPQLITIMPYFSPEATKPLSIMLFIFVKTHVNDDDRIWHYKIIKGYLKKMSESQTKAGNQKKFENLKKLKFKNLNSKFKN